MPDDVSAGRCWWTEEGLVCFRWRTVAVVTSLPSRNGPHKLLMAARPPSLCTAQIRNATLYVDNVKLTKWRSGVTIKVHANLEGESGRGTLKRKKVD